MTQRSQPTTLSAAALPVNQGEAHDFIRAAYGGTLHHDNRS